MSPDPRRVVLENWLQQPIEQGLTHRVAALFSSPSPLRFEFYAGEANPSTEFDLASLTKILCTTRLAARALVEHKIELQETPWPNWPGVSIEHVLSHRAGLPAWTEITCLEDVFAIKPIAKPGVQTLYSDMGFIALGALLEERFGKTLDQLCCKPNLHFKGPEVVDDPRCQVLGGVTGHSGLFGTLGAVYEEAKFFLKCLKSPESSLEFMIKRFAEYPGPRALGFDKPSENGSTGGVLSPESIGHLGYTGTSLWVDPVQRVIYILLMRRLDNGSKSPEIMELRRRFHQQAASLVSSW